MPARPRSVRDQAIDSPHLMSLLIAGTGSFAAEIADWGRAAGRSVSGLIELLDPARHGQRFHGLTAIAVCDAAAGTPVAIGLGGDRRTVWSQLAAAQLTPAAIVHPAAVLAADVELDPGVTIGPLAVIGAATHVGTQAIVSRGALIGHHVDVGAYATLNPGVNIGGNTRIGAGAFIGMGATVVNGTTIGQRAVVAAGAVVLRDVGAGQRVQGLPARLLEPSAP